MRRALTHVGGPVELEGDPEGAQRLASALDVPSAEAAEEEARAHVHGFHSYPARMHPSTAQRLVAAFGRPGALLDPFCGSGTVLVEARLAGLPAVGVDANPLAVRLARLKTADTTAEDRAALVEAAKRAAATADSRRAARAGASRRYGPQDVALFDPHVLLELDGLRIGLDAIEDPKHLEWLELVLSSILTKLSRKASDTSEQRAPRRIAAGYAASLFVRKTEELARRLSEVADRYRTAPPARILEGDARVLEGIAPQSIASAITSPPYPGVYDYLAHHAARLRWLRIDARRFERAEIGARRTLDTTPKGTGASRYAIELGTAMRALGRVLVGGAPLVLLIADGVVGGTPVYALDLLRTLAAPAGFSVRASASQRRPHFHGPTAAAFARRPRREHAVLLERGS